MPYDKKPQMILFDIGGTLFDDGKCIPADGLAQLRLAAENSDVTDDKTLTKLWYEYMEEMSVKLESKSGTALDIPLTAILKYITMHTGLRFNISTAEQEEIFDRYNSDRKLLGGITELLEAINNLGIRAAVISNNAMSGDSLDIAIKHWIPSSKMEFCLTSADLLFTKPNKTLFTAAAGYAQLDTVDCWYCGDSLIPDVDGSRGAGMTPVLIDTKSSLPLEMRTEGGREKYMTVNHWNVLKEHLLKL